MGCEVLSIKGVRCYCFMVLRFFGVRVIAGVLKALQDKALKVIVSNNIIVSQIPISILRTNIKLNERNHYNKTQTHKHCRDIYTNML